MQVGAQRSDISKNRNAYETALRDGKTLSPCMRKKINRVF